MRGQIGPDVNSWSIGVQSEGMRIDHRPANDLLNDKTVVSVIKGQILVVLQKNLKTAKGQNGYMHHPPTIHRCH